MVEQQITRMLKRQGKAVDSFTDSLHFFYGLFMLAGPSIEVEAGNADVHAHHPITPPAKEVILVAITRSLRAFSLARKRRREFSNQRFFFSETAGFLQRAQTTATAGLVYRWGTKQGSW